MVEAAVLLRSAFVVSTFGLLVVDGGLGAADKAYSLFDRLAEETAGVDGLATAFATEYWVG